MPLQPVTSDQVAWYTPTPGQEKRDIESEAYHKAVQQLKVELDLDPNEHIPEENVASIEQVRAEIDKAKRNYEASKKHTSAQKWLEKLSGRIMHYGRVFDALAQHHPEYVALVWGTVKMILMGILNHATLVEELAKALVSIADKLPRAHLNVDLYKTSDMEAALSKLYTSILKFIRLCTQWYHKSSMGRLLSSLKDPFEVKYKYVLEEIELSSHLVENLANAGARVEIRNVHALTESDHAKLLEIDAKMTDTSSMQLKKLTDLDVGVSEMRDGQVTLIDGQTCTQSRFDLIDAKIDTLERTFVNGHLQLFEGQARLEARLTQVQQKQNSDSLTLHAVRHSTHRLELNDVLAAVAPKNLPSEVLMRVQPPAKRRPVLSDTKIESILRDWVNHANSSILVLQASTREQTQAIELAADVVNHLRRAEQYVFWHISSERSAHEMTLEDVLKSILFQALQQGGADLSDMEGNLQTRELTQRTEQEWVDLICTFLAKLPRAFMIIETEDLRKRYQEEKQWADRFFELVKLIVDRTTAAGSQLKVLMILYGDKSNVVSNTPLDPSLRVATLKPPTLVPPRMKHVGIQGLNTRGWKLGGSKPRNRRSS